MRHPPYFLNRRESGVVLISSIIFLLVITLITLSIFRDVGQQEKMAGNQRNKTHVHHAANSALRESWFNLLALEPGERATDARARIYANGYDQDLDGDTATIEADLDVDVAICFEGTSPAPGTDTEFSAYRFRLESTANQAEEAVSRIRQGGYIVAPAPGGAVASTCP